MNNDELEESSLDVSSLDERACVSIDSGVSEQPIPISLPCTSFSRKLDLIPSYPMSLPSFLISPPLEKPLVPQASFDDF